MNFSMKVFVITWLIFLALLSLTLTGAFYLLAHGNEFGSTTITQTRNSTTSIPPFVKSIANMSTIQTSSSESSRVVSDYGQLGVLLASVLGAVIGVAVYASKKLKK